MNDIRKSWKIYSIGLLVVWAIVLMLVWILDSRTIFDSVLLLFAGYFVGWLSATVKVLILTKG